jgi:hypothetical protein
VAKITGNDRHERRLRAMRGPAMAQAVTAAIFVEAQALQADAQLSISEGATSGKGHVPSAPGTPPNNDTGVLAGNIEAVPTGLFKAETSSNAPYAAAQEFGSPSNNLPERPYMRPAAARAKARAPRNIAAAVDKVVRRGT